MSAASLKGPRRQIKNLGLHRSVDRVALWAFGFALSPIIIGFTPVVQAVSLFTIPLAIIFGVIAIFRVRKSIEHKGLAFAFAAIALAILELLFVLLVFFSA